MEVPDSHIKAYAECEDTELAALCDTDYSKVSRAFSAFLFPLGCPRCYSDYMRMVKDMNLDIVSVCTPVETHCQIVCDIAPFVNAIWCEKPIAATLEESDKMIEVCKKNNTLLVINHQRDFTTPTFRFSRGIVQTGTHLFSLLLEHFGNVELDGCRVFLGLEPRIEARIEYIDTEKHIFEFDWVHNKERMLPKVLRALVSRLSFSTWQGNAPQAREALRLAIEFGGRHGRNRRHS
jgi:hypothetical protein|tara:strand:- start:7439 stop:8143 length:705 start_codon:yes stop_codon:yes gene_type:complete